MPGLDFFRKLGLYIVEDFLDTKSANRYRAEMLGAPEYTGLVGAGVVDENIRRVKWASVDREVSGALREQINSLKPLLEQHFAMSLDRCERPAFLSYAEGAFYSPHRDHSPDPASLDATRKVSVVVFLNDRTDTVGPPQFAGGDLVFHGLMQKPGWEKCAFTLEPKACMLVAFKSDIIHEVRTVTAGDRVTLVSWFHAGAEVSEASA